MKKVVIFGGGTGLSYLLNSLKTLNIELVVVVATTDNGGSSGELRRNYNIPAPGDLRRAVIALSEREDIDSLMNFRFDQQLNYHTVGNLVLAALVDKYKTIDVAVNKYAELLDVKEKIFPISNEHIQLNALLEDGTKITGEQEMSSHKQQIKKVYYDQDINANQNIIKELKEADYVILSSGSLYTSILSNLVFKNILDVLPDIQAKLIYICNLMTEDGETNNFLVSDHIRVIEEHFNNKEIIDYVLVNKNFNYPKNIYQNYISEEADLVLLDKSNIRQGIKIVDNDYLLISKDNHIRHNTDLVTKDLKEIIGC